MGFILGLVIAGVLLAALVASLRPLPGRYLAMATGPQGSAYERAGQRYREILARDGVHLRLVPTNGAIANADLLADPRSGVSVGFVQGGTVPERAASTLESLGTVFYEPVWFFCHCADEGRPFAGQSNPRVSIGAVGSADRVLALKLLALNGFDTRQLQLFPYQPEEAAQRLLANELDAVLIMTAWDSPVVQRLVRAPGVTLRGFPRADAYVALDPTLSKLILPRGVADLAHDRPPEDTPLIASKASLAVRADLHPALQYLLLRAAMEIHARGSLFGRAGEFPAAEVVDLPLSKEARDMYRAGPSFLQRSLPFWLAVLVQRILILIIPVVGIIYPLWSLVPRLYRWQMQRRVFHIYGELSVLESGLSRSPNDRILLTRLDGLEQRVLEMRLPTAYSEMTYNLRGHIRAVRQRVRDGVAGQTPAADQVFGVRSGGYQ